MIMREGTAEEMAEEIVEEMTEEVVLEPGSRRPWLPVQPF
jgi:hypothetical protein